MIFVLLLISLFPAHSNSEQIIFNLEAQVSDIKKTIEHSQQFIDSHDSTSYIPLIESDVQRLEEQIKRLKDTLQYSLPSLPPQKNHDDTTLHK